MPLSGFLPRPLTLLRTSTPACGSWISRKPLPSGHKPPACPPEHAARCAPRATSRALASSPWASSCLLTYSPGSVASRFGVLFGKREAFIAGTLFALGLSILFPSKPFLESTVGTSEHLRGSHTRCLRLAGAHSPCIPVPRRPRWQQPRRPLNLARH